MERLRVLQVCRSATLKTLWEDDHNLQVYSKIFIAFVFPCEMAFGYSILVEHHVDNWYPRPQLTFGKFMDIAGTFILEGVEYY